MQSSAPTLSDHNMEPSDLPNLGRLKFIKDEETFLDGNDQTVDKNKQGYQHFIFEARCIIDRVDPNICDFMGNFKLSAEPNGNIGLSPEVIEKLDGSPQEFLMALVRYIDFEDISPKIVERNIQTLAGFVAQRFLAISLVAHGKKMNGETTSFHPERHEDVLKKNAGIIAHNDREIPICRKIFGEFMEAGCDIQDAYINNQEGQEAIANKLSQHGVTQLIQAPL